MGSDGDPQHVLKRVGLIAIAVGSFDVLYLVYAIAHGMDYVSSLNIFAIIAGILLYRESVQAARVCANLCACFLGVTAGVVVLAPLVLLALFPLDFLVSLRHDPSLSSAPMAFASLWMGITVALFAYANNALTTGAVISLYGATPPRPYWRSRWSAAGIILAAGVLATTGMFLNVLLNSAPAHRAVQKAQERLGPVSASYAFQVTDVHVTRDDSGTTVNARVLAYNANEVRHIDLEWEE